MLISIGLFSIEFSSVPRVYFRVFLVTDLIFHDGRNFYAGTKVDFILIHGSCFLQFYIENGR